MDLKSFLLKEEVKRSHAERYLDFIDHDHPQVIQELKQALTDAWTKQISALTRTYPISPERAQDALFKNPKALTRLEVINHAEKLAATHSRSVVEVSPSVKIPHIYNREESELIARELVATAVEVFNTVAENWRAVLNFEKKGQITPWFKIVHDHHEARFQLATSSATIESYKTLYCVKIEYGKQNSKLRSFDRVYLASIT